MTDSSPDQLQQDIVQRFYESLMASREISRQQLQRYQQDVATTLVEYVSSRSAWHASRLAPVLGNGEPDFSRWQEVPILTKQELRATYHRWRLDDVPESHGRVILSESSSSTGISVALPKTQMTDTATACASFRHASAFGLDYRTPLVMLRSLNPMLARQRSHDVEQEQMTPASPRNLWGPNWLDDHLRGPRHILSINQSCTDILDRLDKITTESGSCYLNTTPSKALELANHVRRQKRKPPAVKALLSVGEVVTAAHRHEVRSHLGCEMIDAYATAETGPIAMQCPESGLYHMQSELAWIELLGNDGEPVKPGQTGRVIVTPFYNLAMPLIRYDTGDLAVAGAACKCDVPHPVIASVVGRASSQPCDSQGQRLRFHPDFEAMRLHIGECRWRLVQVADGLIELQYMQRPVAEAIDHEGAAGLARRLLKSNDMEIKVREVPVLGLTGGGKFGMLAR